jgi:hypothetical protein
LATINSNNLYIFFQFCPKFSRNEGNANFNIWTQKYK